MFSSFIYNLITQETGALIGLLGVGISIYSSWKLNQQSIAFQKEVIEHNKTYDQWRNKYNTLVQLIASRNDVGTYDFMGALNGVPATYFDSPEVLQTVNEFFEVVSRTDKTSEEANEKILEIFIAMFESLEINDIDTKILKKTFNISSESHKEDQYPEIIEIHDLRSVDTLILNSNRMRLSGQTKPYNQLILEASSHNNTFTAQEIADSEGKFTITIPNIPSNELFKVAITDDFITDGINIQYKERILLDQQFNMIYRQNTLLTNNALFEILYITPYESNKIIVRFKITNRSDFLIDPIKEFQEKIIIYQKTADESHEVSLQVTHIKDVEKNSDILSSKNEKVSPNNSNEYEAYYQMKYTNENIYYKLNDKRN